MKHQFALPASLILLICLFLTVMCWVEITGLKAENLDMQEHLEIIEGKIRRQQTEYDELQRVLPGMREENAQLLPQAQAALDLEAELKTQRRSLRRELETLEEEMALTRYRFALYENIALTPGE